MNKFNVICHGYVCKLSTKDWAILCNIHAMKPILSNNVYSEICIKLLQCDCKLCSWNDQCFKLLDIT